MMYVRMHMCTIIVMEMNTHRPLCVCLCFVFQTAKLARLHLHACKWVWGDISIWHLCHWVKLLLIRGVTHILSEPKWHILSRTPVASGTRCHLHSMTPIVSELRWHLYSVIPALMGRGDTSTTWRQPSVEQADKFTAWQLCECSEVTVITSSTCLNAWEATYFHNKAPDYSKHHLNTLTWCAG